jgi:hypothetical protein
MAARTGPPPPASSRTSEPVRGIGAALLAEMTGTALLVTVGLSFVILDFGGDSPVPRWISDAGWRWLRGSPLALGPGCCTLVTLSLGDVMARADMVISKA